MKHKRVVAALALAFALGIGISFFDLSTDPSTHAVDIDVAELNAAVADTPALELAGSMVLADEPEEEAGVVRTNDVDTFAQAVLASTTSKIVLTGDIVVPNTNKYLNGVLMYRQPTLAPLVVDLNGYNITAECQDGLHFLFGSFELTGQGTITAPRIAVIVKGSYDSNDTNYTNVTIGENVTISAPAGYGLLLDQTAKDGKYAPYAYGVKVIINGTINAKQGPYVNGSIKHTDNTAQIVIGDTAEINAEEMAIYAAGYANWQIGAAHIFGDTGIGIKAGNMTLNSTNITATGMPVTPSPTSGGMDSTGAVFQIEHHKSYADQIELKVNGGTYTSLRSDVFYEYGLTGNEDEELTQADIDITAGNFTAGLDHKIFGGDTEEMNIEISGGTFKGTDTASFAEAGYLVGNVTIDENGNVVAAQPVTPIQPGRPGASNNGGDGTSQPSTDDEDKTPADEDQTAADTPNTGAILGQGISSAVSTLAPVLGLVALVTMVYGRKVFRRRHAAQMAATECEINAELHELVEPEEPVQDNFVATPMTETDAEEMRMNMFFPKPKKSENSENSEK